MKEGRKRKDSEIVEGFNHDPLSGMTQKVREAAKKEAVPKKPRKKKEIDPDQLLNDLKTIYSQMNGKKKLKELMLDDREFKFMIKELLRVEAAQLVAKIRKGETREDNGGFFVVMKGLEQEQVIESDLDLKQIERALDPENEHTDVGV